MTIDAGELLPCPFCGGTNIQALEHLDWVACNDCGASLEDCEPSARELWNRRQTASHGSAGGEPINDEMIERAIDAHEELFDSGDAVGAMRAALNAALSPPVSKTGGEADELWSRKNLIALMTAVSKAHGNISEQEMFGKIADAMIEHLGRPAQAVQVPTDDLTILVEGFAKALLAKLRLAQANGRHGWEKNDWERECQQGLLRHVAKGDPRDVAAYCAFMWHHDWVTTPPPWPSDGEMLDLLVAAGYDSAEVHPKCYRGFGWKTFTEKLRAYAIPSASSPAQQLPEPVKKLLLIAEDIVWFDWSGDNNDADAIHAIDQLRIALSAVPSASRGTEA